MTATVYRLHSTLELPLEDFHEFIEELEVPESIDGVELARRNNTLELSAVAHEGTVDKYTPTAQLKGTVTETRIPVEPVPERGPGWTREEEEEIETIVIEMAGFKGRLETVLQNTALQYPMFEVLCELARVAESGKLEAIVEEDGVLHPVRIVDGEDRPATIEIVEEPDQNEAGGGVNWRNNEYIT